MSRDIIKELVDKEVDLEQCIKTIHKLSEDSAKIISGSNSSSISISMSQKFKTDADVFSEMIIDELKRKNRDLKFALIARDQRLEDAASKVTQLFEQNTLLSQKVERAAMDHSNQVRDLIEAQKRYVCTIHKSRHNPNRRDDVSWGS
jgi:predicted CopG family antitoxin